MSAKTVGMKVGSLSAKTAAKAWGLTCRAAEGLGELGEGFVEGAETGWEAETAAIAQRREERIASNAIRLQALRLKLEAARAEALVPAVETAPAVAIKGKRTAA